MKAFTKTALSTLISLAFLLSGCGDDNLYESLSDSSGGEAKREEGVEALDNEQWDEAIAIFSGQEDSDMTRKYWASAHMGKAEFDTLELVALIDEAQEDSGDASVLLDSAMQIFDDDNDGSLDLEALNYKLDEVEKALDVLIAGGYEGGYSDGNTDTTGLTEDRLVQTGIFAAVHAVLTISEGIDVTGMSDDWRPLDISELHPSSYAVTLPETLDADLALLDAASEAIIASTTDGSSEISEDFDEFLLDIGYADDNSVSKAELTAYLNSLY